MSGAPGTANRTTWLIITGALAIAPVMYVVVAWLIAQDGPPVAGPDYPTFRIVCATLAIASIVASRVVLLGLGRDRPDPRTGEPVPIEAARYQLHSLLAAALAESCAIYGFVLFLLGGPIRLLAVFAAGSLLAIAAFVIPHGLAYWERREAYRRTHPS
jgi:hypothetical protein